MDNFFNNAFDYSVFKKALKVTDGETVVINILSSDNSLKQPTTSKSPNKARKSMSSKFEPSPFGKFFGSRSTGPVDMNDFSSWKNKNYRKAEETFEEADEEDTIPFSLSSYMQDRSNDTYNELDQARSDIQKPITQLANDDPTLQKFSLDGYMHKLEESILAKDKFSQNDDLLEPIISNDDDEDFVNKNTVREINKYQDENFFGGNGDIERFAFDEAGVSGNRYSLNSDELDKVKDRLERLEREANNLKSKSNEKLITGDEFAQQDEVKNIDEEDEEKDDFEDLLISKTDKIDTGIEESDSSNSNRGTKLNEVVMHTEAEQVGVNNHQRPIIISTDDINSDEPITIMAESSKDEDEIKKSDILTKEDFRDMTNEFMTKFTEILGKPNNEPVEEIPQDYMTYETPAYDYDQMIDYQNNQDELQMKINELVESKNRTEQQTQEELRKIEEERRRINEEYNMKLKQMEESYSKKYEEFKQKMYLDKLANDKKNEIENLKRIQGEELENKNLSNKQKGAILKKELKSNFNIANLEMEKKLLEVSSQIEKEENKKLKEDLSQKSTAKKAQVVAAPAPVVAPPPVVAAPPAPKKSPTRRRRRGKPRWRIDSDIIGGINFD